MKNNYFLSRLMIMAFVLTTLSCNQDDDVPATPNPVANFTHTVSTANPLSVTFTNTSTNATSYSWDFGDQSPVSTDANTTHVYAEGGTYSVTLTASRDGLSNTQTHQVTVTDPDDGNGGGDPDPDVVSFPITFETEEPEFIAFGGSTFEVVDNPDPSGINTSERVGMTVHGNEPWAGFFVDLGQNIDLTGNDQLAVKVWAPIEGEFNIKFEDSENSAIFFEQAISVETTEEWVEIVLDLTQVTGGPYDRLVLFPGFNTTTDETYYIDDITLRTGDGDGNGGVGAQPGDNIIVGGDMTSEEPWTVTDMGAPVLTNTEFTQDGLIFSNITEQTDVAVWQAVEVEAGQTYQISAQVSGGGTNNSWLQIMIGREEPRDEETYWTDNFDADLFLAFSSFGGDNQCGHTTFNGNFAELACEGDGVDEDGMITFTESGTIYFVIKAGSWDGSLGDGITITDVEMVLMEEEE